jgi:hypothetical protein
MPFAGTPRQTLTGALQSLMHVSFNSTNEMIAGASNDNATRLWHLGTGRIRVSTLRLLWNSASVNTNEDFVVL